MSDVERPRYLRSPGGQSPSLPSANSPAPARNMADIAKIFLDGVRPGNNGAPAPRRSPPAPMPQPHTAAPPPASRPADLPKTAPQIHGVPALLLGLALPSRDAAAWRLLTSAAAGLALKQATTVGLLGMKADAAGPVFVIDILGAESPDDLPEIRPSNAAPDLQVARALYTLRPAVGIWLIAAPDPDSPAFAAMAAIVPDWLLACPTDNHGLVGAYQHLKHAWLNGRAASADPGRPPAIFLLDEDPANAAKVHHRLRAAAREFLKTDLTLAGISPLETDPPTHILSLPICVPEEAIWASVLDELAPAGEIINETEVPAPPRPPEALPAKTTASPSHRTAPTAGYAPTDIEAALENIASGADEIVHNSAAATLAVFDHLTQVLDPEERAALSAAFDDPPDPPARQEQAHASAHAAADPAFPPGENQPLKTESPFPALRAFDLLETPSQSRDSQWQAVERSIRDLVPHSILLDARPPMSWATETCIAIDPDGRLHIWTLYKDGASWFALREWASEHRNLLALTRRDLVLCKEADVVVHIVLPLEAPPAPPTPASSHAATTGKPSDGHTPAAPNIVNTILRTAAKNIHLYRLRCLQWNSRQGMIVVPIA